MKNSNNFELVPIGSDYKSILPHHKIPTPQKEMNAWVSYKDGKTLLEKVPIPKVLHNDVLIEVLWISICPSDIKRLKDKGLNLEKNIYGHEFAGRIISIGKYVDKNLLGQIVVIEEHYPCLNCDECKKGHYDNCKKEGFLGWYKSGNHNDWVRNGSFAEYVSIHHSCAKKTEGIEKLDFFPSLAEPFGNAVKMEMTIREVCNDIPETIVIWGGCGLQGSYMSAYFSTKGVKNIILLDINDVSIHYMKKQSESLKAKFYLLNIKNHKKLILLKKKLRQENGFVNIDLTGNSNVIELILRYANPNGKIFFFGFPDNYKKTIIPGTNINLYYFLIGKIGIEWIKKDGIIGVRVIGRDNKAWEKTIKVLKKDKNLRRFILNYLVLAGSFKNIGKLIGYIKSNGSRYYQPPYGLRPAKFGVISERMLSTK